MIVVAPPPPLLLLLPPPPPVLLPPLLELPCFVVEQSLDGGAVAQAQTELAPAMTAGREAPGQAVTTQGTRIWDRDCWAFSSH